MSGSPSGKCVCEYVYCIRNWNADAPPVAMEGKLIYELVSSCPRPAAYLIESIVAIISISYAPYLALHNIHSERK